MELDLEEKIAFAAIAGTALAALFMPYEVYEPMKLGEYALSSIAISIIGVIIIQLILVYLAWLMWRTYRLLTWDAKWVFKDIVITFSLAATSMTLAYVRFINLLVLGGTDAAFYLFGKRYIDPMAFGILIVLMSYSAYFYYLWSIKHVKVYSRSTALLALPVYVVQGVLAIHPANNYGNLVEYVTPVKVASRVGLLIAFLIPTVVILVGIRSASETPERMRRIVLLEASNVLILISIVFWILDGLSEETYSVYIAVFHILSVLGFVGIALAILWPSWVAKIFEARSERGGE